MKKNIKKMTVQINEGIAQVEFTVEKKVSEDTTLEDLLGKGKNLTSICSGCDHIHDAVWNFI